MRISVISDLHLEVNKCEFTPINCDIMILAGDIHTGTNALSFIKYHISQGVKHILYVLGNHEFYNKSLYKESKLYSIPPRLSDTYNNTINDWLKLDEEIEELHILHNKVFVYENLKFIGTTLWTDFNTPDKIEIAPFIMNDYNYIKYNSKYIKPNNILDFYKNEKKWLEEQLQLSTKSEYIIFVITHHLPSYKCIHKSYETNNYNCFWASNLDYLMEKYKIDYWVHGHTHSTIDTKIHNTRVICNPRGYGSQNNEFDYNYILTI